MLLFLQVVGSFWGGLDNQPRTALRQAGRRVCAPARARGRGRPAALVDTVMSGGYIAETGPVEAFWMARALERARLAASEGEVPVGALVVRDGVVLGSGCNATERSQDPTAHAEMIAIRQAAEAIGTRRFHDTALYVTLEPCAMCAGAIVLARIPRILFGAHDPKAGACGTLRNVVRDPRLNHTCQVVGGVLESECAGLLRPEVGTFSRAERCPSGRRGRSRKPLWPSRSPWVRIPPSPPSGEMTEWSKVHDWKSCVAFIASPRVRIPLSPPDPEYGGAVAQLGER